jgi:hypothetical protein
MLGTDEGVGRRLRGQPHGPGHVDVLQFLLGQLRTERYWDFCHGRFLRASLAIWHFISRNIAVSPSPSACVQWRSLRAGFQ